jgi:hypothetical protein
MPSVRMYIWMDVSFHIHSSPSWYISVGIIFSINFYSITSVNVTGYGFPWDCEALKVSHFIDNPLSDGIEVVLILQLSIQYGI